MSRSLPRALRVGLPSSLLLAGACGFGTINISGISMREEDKAVREEDHPLQLSPSDVLTLQGANEGVEVVASDKEPPSLHVTFTARGRNRAESEKILERYHVSVEKSAQGVDVDSMGEPFEIAEEGMTIKIGAGIAYRATVPKGTALVARSSSGRVRVAGPVGRSDLETGYGSVSVRQVDGDLRVRSSSGSIEVARVQGKLEARSGYGSIGLADVAGPSVEAESSSGNLRLERVKAERVEARTGYGRVDLEHVEGKVEATSSSGAIDVEDSAGPLSLQSGYGSIEVDRAANGVRASTSSGHV
ncbi:MAG TPA: DUF4097 family beta strand repeat-containing protein, partial [Planctomycetota bacterium]|nr:DUF4097 family beta strand repeat-containing protein [Planctomycetota bacterium]